MEDRVPPAPERVLGLPVVLIVGTSMSAGKTTSARAIVRLLREDGLTVIGAKLTGAGRYRDILAILVDTLEDMDVRDLQTTFDPEDFSAQSLS